ncbi:MAG: hypothetical protein ABI581_15285, partial [Sediminibacterium sp.]
MVLHLLVNKNLGINRNVLQTGYKNNELLITPNNSFHFCGKYYTKRSIITVYLKRKKPCLCA